MINYFYIINYFNENEVLLIFNHLIIISNTNNMRKTLKRQESLQIKPRNSKKRASIPIHVNSPLQQIEQQIQVSCPNCDFHFKVGVRLQGVDLHQFNNSSKVQQFGTLIEKEYSLISHFSQSRPFIENSPSLLAKTKPEVLDLRIDRAQGLEKLQILNSIKSMQDSKLNDSKATIRFSPSPDEKGKQKSNDSPKASSFKLAEKEDFKDKQQIIQQKVSIVIENPQLKSKLVEQYQILKILGELILWISTNGYHKLLPAYLLPLFNYAIKYIEQN